MLKKRLSRRQSSAVDKENRKDRWGKLVEKAPVNDSRTQVVGTYSESGATMPSDGDSFWRKFPFLIFLTVPVTTDSLKELSAELQKEQSRKKSVDEGAVSGAPAEFGVH